MLVAQDAQEACTGWISHSFGQFLLFSEQCCEDVRETAETLLESQRVLCSSAWEACFSTPAPQRQPAALSISIRNALGVEVTCQIPGVQDASLGGLASHLLFQLPGIFSVT